MENREPIGLRLVAAVRLAAAPVALVSADGCGWRRDALGDEKNKVDEDNEGGRQELQEVADGSPEYIADAGVRTDVKRHQVTHVPVFQVGHLERQPTEELAGQAVHPLLVQAQPL